MRRLDEESRELEGLMVRLSPVGSDEREAAMASFEPPAPAELRLLDAEAEAVEPPTAAAPNAAEDEGDDLEIPAREERP